MAVYFFAPKAKVLHGILGGENLYLEIADTSILHEKGLSLHKPLAPNEGMIFIFSSDGKYGFWMKDMLFPIDILWLDSEYRIVYVKEDVAPSSYPEVFMPTTQARFVLELPAGFFKKHELHLGDTLKISR
ncbi:MAG: DUF192 domain-containing protein [Candidatus Pacebacteria bacterium]|nr:DUF192 domain-containing protein [Candidatus Paceibacterota bacterium]